MNGNLDRTPIFFSLYKSGSTHSLNNPLGLSEDVSDFYGYSEGIGKTFLQLSVHVKTDFHLAAKKMKTGTRWSDPRIFFPNKPPENSSHSRHTTSNNLTVTSIDYNFIDYLWKPAFMVRRSKSIKFVSDLR